MSLARGRSRSWLVAAAAWLAFPACGGTVSRPEARPGDDGGTPALDTSPLVDDDGAIDAPGDEVDAGPIDTGFFDPGTEYIAPPDCGTLDGESPDADPEAGGIPTGTRFCELYRDLVHHTTGAAKCQSLGCHGGDHGQHGLSMGYEMKTCYDAMTTYVTTFFKPDERLVSPVPGGDSTALSAIMRYVAPLSAGAKPFMPVLRDSLGNRKLTAEEQERVRIWLRRGAPYD